MSQKSKQDEWDELVHKEANECDAVDHWSVPSFKAGANFARENLLLLPEVSELIEAVDRLAARLTDASDLTTTDRCWYVEELNATIAKFKEGSK